MLCLRPAEMADVGAIVTENARKDIAGSDVGRSASASDSRTLQTLNKAVDADDPTQNPLVQSLYAVVEKLDIVVHIVDDVVKVTPCLHTQKLCFSRCFQIHPYVNFAWQVTSSLYKVSVLR